jgi:5'(3')-deoxyribonucleotidase
MRCVLLDCDGLLSDFTRGALSVVERTLGRRHVPEDIWHWDFCKALGIVGNDRIRVMQAISDDRSFAVNLPILPGALDGVRRLREIAEVHVVTSPWNTNSGWTYERERWLLRNFEIDHKHVHHSSAKYLFAGDVFVDDKASHVAEWVAAHRGKLAVLWRTLHNQTEAVPTGAAVSSSWDLLVEWVSP